MRLISEFALDKRIKASLFSWNGKFLVKLESDQLEQTYKFRETDLDSPEALKDWMNSPGFLEKIRALFAEMETLQDACF
jgi:hypothetical protein